MSTSHISNSDQPRKTRYLALWLALPLALIVWDVLPWAIALLTPHFGWTAGIPGPLNWLGLVPVLIGNTGLIWGVIQHAANSAGGIEWELDKSYLLTHGPYAFSRNPMYIAEMILLFGWVIFYGSIALFIACLVWGAFFRYLVHNEERILETHFGETYLQYKARIPRWLGKPRN